MTGPAFDAVIAGGGLSGLSLAAHLATRGWSERSVLVVDHGGMSPATTWGWWSSTAGLLDDAVSRSFRQVRVHADGVSRVVALHPYRYRVVRRADLRRVVLGFLRACPRFRVVEGHVEAVRDRGDTAEAIVDGEAVHASWIFDSTGGPGGEADVDARLAFTGYEIATSRSVFDPETPVLFDFRTPQVAGARFGYVLPDGSSRALVELTEFVPRHGEPPSEPERRAALETYIRDVVGTPEYTIRRTESAVVPLRVRPGARGRGRVLCIGARGGLIKATTGYAYQRIQRDSEAIADSLARHGHPWDISGSLPRHRLLDAILLAVLDREPAQLEHAFARLFARNPGARILRFLDEDTGVRDEARLVRSLSPGPFVRAASSQAFRRRQAAGR